MYQFLHYETYSLSATKKTKSFASVARELMRHKDAVPHIKNPSEPKVLFGVDAYQAEAEIRRRAKNGMDKMGRKLRRDALVVLSGVMSYERNEALQDKKKFQSWVHSNINYLKVKYKKNLLSIILHLDEEHPHLHFIVAPDDTDEKGLCNIMYQFEPVFARQTTQGGRKARYDAYKKAAREIQDDYYNKESIRYGMLRTGAGRQRLTRSEHNARKAQASEIAKAYEMLTAQVESFDNLENIYSKIEFELNAKDTSLNKREAAIVEKENSLSLEECKLIERKKEFVRDAKAHDKDKFIIMRKDIVSLTAIRDKLQSLYNDLKSRFNKLLTEHNALKKRYSDLEKECSMYKVKSQKRYELLKLAKQGKLSVTNIDIELNHR